MKGEREYMRTDSLLADGPISDDDPEFWSRLFGRVNYALRECSTAAEEQLVLQRMTAGQRLIHQLSRFHGIVDNGGFCLYFATDWVVDDLIYGVQLALVTVRAKDYLDVLTEALALFPHGFLEWPCSERNRTLSGLSADDRAKLDKLDMRFYSLHRSVDNLDSLTRCFVIQNPTEFYRVGTGDESNTI